MGKLREKLPNLFLFNEPEKKEEFILRETEEEKASSEDNSNADTNDNPKVNAALIDNLNYLKGRYSVPLNADVITREFSITIGDKKTNAFIIFFDGMIDKKSINDNVLEPLMLLSSLNIKYIDENNIAACVKNQLLPYNQIKETAEFIKLMDEVSSGSCALFIDGLDICFCADVKGYEHRSVEKPNNELVIRGPQEGFNETLRVNTALIRKRIKNENLIVENIEVGARSKTPCAVLYIKDIVNDSLINEIRKRISSIDTDYIIDSGELEQFIEDKTFFPAPQMLGTERPDRVASMLLEGRVGIIVNGSPYCLVAPITFYDLMHSPEDIYTRFPIGNLLRFIRLIGVFSALLLPSFYIAITNFHHEMIPTSLLLAIEASREKVPFPSVLEILLMELSFELIREAGIRIPGPIGPTLGIIGAIILGQAAVAANIVSPILIIIVAVTGIGSFAMPNFDLGLQFRILRFGYIILAAMSGFLGIATGIFIHGLYLCSAKSFGVPFLAPYAPKTSGGYRSEFIKAPIWAQEERADYFNTKDSKKQPNKSRGWTK
ncbi:spore germination protein [Clostridium sp. 19966]|uniref:spore germination protein n=1 Tax=Clostridium sp. 19966 TaxID=2768166 RepID=UPI0028DF18DA|nr:spore germination protein [Clostridium sp. 19966]